MHIGNIFGLMGGNSKLINSVQQFSITIANGAATGTASISAVGAVASLVNSGYSSDNSGTNSGVNDLPYLSVSGTTVTATRNGTSGTLTVKGCIVDWNNAFMKSAQNGSFNITSTNLTGTASISAVVAAAAGVFWLGNSASIAGTHASALTYLNRTSTTQITGTRITGTSGTIISGFSALEAQSGTLNTNTQEATTNIASGTTADSTISSVTTSRTLMAYGGRCHTNASWNGSTMGHQFLASATKITGTIDSATASFFVATTFDFKAANVNNVQRGHATEINSAGNAFADVTITAVVLANAIQVYHGERQTTGSSAVSNLVESSAALTSTTNLRLAKGAASSTVCPTPSYEVFESK